MCFASGSPLLPFFGPLSSLSGVLDELGGRLGKLLSKCVVLVVCFGRAPGLAVAQTGYFHQQFSSCAGFYRDGKYCFLGVVLASKERGILGLHWRLWC